MKHVLARLLGLELLFVLLWNSGFIGAEYGLPFSGPWSLLFWRYLILTALLGLWLWLRGRLIWPGLNSAAHTALVGVLAHAVWLGCVLVSLDMGVPAGIVALVTALQPLLTGALSGPVLGERTDRWQWLGLVLGFCGVVIAVGARLSQDSETSLWGYLIPFGSVVAITIASLLQRRRERDVRVSRLSDINVLFYQSAASALVLVLPAWLWESFYTEWTLPFIATMGWLVLVVSLGAYWSMWRLLVRHDATRVASLFYLSPPVTMLMAWAAFGDRLIMTDVIGLAIAGLGVMLVYRLGFRRPDIKTLPPR
ncbi:DMT family transporter [Thiohalophilus sp.]|uniref:DMT family transporter n=1 Tax=Thiohalophilus sp. TaxID=3028392 RepID=UPI002ACE1BEA|nr:DMT family transporter [Thiohalophilus sp.]MDZ7661081.1 DMT family transporter [Thiohalophilus sp.]